MALDELKARLRREAEPTRQMAMGTAWHKILENPPSDELDVVESDGFRFVLDCEAEVALPQVREIRATKDYYVDGVTVTLTGGCDGITGNVVTDWKLTARPDPEKYLDSYQWRAYLDIFGADAFEYVLCHAKDGGDVVTILSVSPFRFYRYPQMGDHLLAGIREFVAFCRDHMPERLEAA